MNFTVPKGSAASRRWRSAVHRGRRSLALSAAVAAILTSLAAEAPAAAAPVTTLDGLSDRDRAVMTEQAPYMELDEQVRRIASAQANSPLAGTRIDRVNQALHVYWMGAAPADLRSIQESAAQQGITVKIVPAAFSEQTLMAAATDLSTVAESTRAELSVTIHNDGSGLTVHQDGLMEVSEGRKAPTQVQSQILDAVNAISARSRVPITVADRGPGRSVLADRDNDGIPHWGGAITVGSGFGTCTDSFSMYATGSPSTRFMLTAAHCTGFRDGITVANGGGGRMGVTDFIHELFDVAPRYDIGVIRIDPNPTIEGNKGRVYSNWTQSNGFYVKGLASGIPRGGTYCVSAAVSAPNCTLISGNQILLCDDEIPFRRCIYYIEWLSDGGFHSYCRGDSGGPIYYWTSAGIIAAGMPGFGYLDGTPNQQCFNSGGISVVASAVNRIPGLAVLHG